MALGTRSHVVPFMEAVNSWPREVKDPCVGSCTQRDWVGAAVWFEAYYCYFKILFRLQVCSTLVQTDRRNNMQELTK